MRFFEVSVDNSDILVSMAVYSINHMDNNIKGRGVRPHTGVLPHLTLPLACEDAKTSEKLRS